VKLVIVSAVVLLRNQKILLGQRPKGKAMAGYWEFPGGKLEVGESPEQALARECQEELGITVDVADLTPLHFASHRYDAFHLLMPLYGCTQWQGEPESQENQSLKWASLAELTRYPLLPADIPLLPAVETFIHTA